jgi:hypothetical protein
MRPGATERFDRHKRMRSGDFPHRGGRDYAAAMSTQQENSRMEKSADLLRVGAAIGILGLFACFDGSGDTTPAAGAAVASVTSP